MSHDQPSDGPLSSPLPLEDMSQQLLAFSAHADRQSRERYEEMLPRIALKFTGDEVAAREAMACGGFRQDDVTLAIRFNEELQQIELFCDVGLPEPHVEAQVHRAALEHNLYRTYPGIMLGVHPESGHLVATTSLQMLLVTHEDVCVNTLQIMCRMALDMRSAMRVQAAPS